MDIATLIQSLGFPVACVIALGWFMVKKDDREQTQQEKREDKIMEQLAEVNITNKLILEANREILETNRLLMEDYRNDLRDIKNSLEEIKRM